MKFILSVCLLFCLLQVNSAHPGGHFNQHDRVVLNQWELNNGQKLLGNFTCFKGEEVYLEVMNGKIISIPLKMFSQQDQLLLKAKMRRIASFNQIPLEENVHIPIHQKPYFIFLGLSLVFMIWLIYRIPVNRSWYIFNTTNNLKHMLAVITSLLFIIACSKKETVQPSDNNNNTSTATIPKSRLTFLDSAFQLFKPV